MGEEIVRSLLSAAKSAGAAKAYLQVVNTNTAAKKLYAKLGFTEHYTYRHRRKSTSGA